MRLSRKEARLERMAHAVLTPDRREALLWIENMCEELIPETGAVGPARGGRYPSGSRG